MDGRTYAFTLAAIVGIGGCAVPVDEADATSDAVTRAAESVVIVALDGPRDHGEIDRALLQDLDVCLASGVRDGRQGPVRHCHALIPSVAEGASDDYATVEAHCRAPGSGCTVGRFESDEALLEQLRSPALHGRVGLVIGHHTLDDRGRIWDHPGLTAKELNAAAGFPLVLRMCFGEQFETSEFGDDDAARARARRDPGLVSVGNTLLAFADRTYVETIREVWFGRAR